MALGAPYWAEPVLNRSAGMQSVLGLLRETETGMRALQRSFFFLKHVLVSVIEPASSLLPADGSKGCCSL